MLRAKADELVAERGRRGGTGVVRRRLAHREPEHERDRDARAARPTRKHVAPAERRDEQAADQHAEHLPDR